MPGKPRMYLPNVLCHVIHQGNKASQGTHAKWLVKTKT